VTGCAATLNSRYWPVLIEPSFECGAEQLMNDMCRSWSEIFNSGYKLFDRSIPPSRSSSGGMRHVLVLAGRGVHAMLILSHAVLSRHSMGGLLTIRASLKLRTGEDFCDEAPCSVLASA